jgi:hypothetical protein
MEEVRHKHYEYIIAWAKGATIQRRYSLKNIQTEVAEYHWRDEPKPDWNENEVYRLKPIYKTKEVKITLLYHNWYIEPVVDGCGGNCLITYNAIDEQIIDISRLKE